MNSHGLAIYLMAMATVLVGRSCVWYRNRFFLFLQFSFFKFCSSSREMRNRAEKQRRDKLNAYISELYTLVPSAAAAPRKLDKTSTLRLSANFLRIHQSKLHRRREKWRFFFLAAGQKFDYVTRYSLSDVDLRMKPYNRWNAIAGHTILEVSLPVFAGPDWIFILVKAHFSRFFS